MLEYALDKVSSMFEVEEKNPGKYAVIKKKGLTFQIRWFFVKGVGNLSVLSASGMFGLMKMDTLILTPEEKDLPLFSYDRIHVMGRDTLLIEFYDTMVIKEEEWKEADSLLQKWKAEAGNLAEYNTGEHWYDGIRLSSSLAKHGNKKNKRAFDELFKKEWDLYLATASKMLPCKNKEEKRNKTKAYVNGLFEHGGPSTDSFVKLLGKKDAMKLFGRIIFGTDK